MGRRRSRAGDNHTPSKHLGYARRGFDSNCFRSFRQNLQKNGRPQFSLKKPVSMMKNGVDSQAIGG